MEPRKSKDLTTGKAIKVDSRKMSLSKQGQVLDTRK